MRGSTPTCAKTRRVHELKNVCASSQSSEPRIASEKASLSAAQSWCRLDLRAELLPERLERFLDRAAVEREPAHGVAADPDPVARLEPVLGAAGDGPEALVELLEAAVDDVGAVAGGGCRHAKILSRC